MALASWFVALPEKQLIEAAKKDIFFNIANSLRKKEKERAFIFVVHLKYIFIFYNSVISESKYF